MTVRGDANRSDVLRLAGAQRAETIIVATNSDPTAVLVTRRPARELAPEAKIIASVRRPRTSTCSASPAPTRWWCPRRPRPVARHRGQHPAVVELMEDLLTPTPDWPSPRRRSTQAGRRLAAAPADDVLGVVRDGELMRVDDPQVDSLGNRRPAALHPQRRRGGLMTHPRRPRTVRPGFRLRNTRLLSRIGADRADHLRTDIDAATPAGPTRRCCGSTPATRC